MATTYTHHHTVLHSSQVRRDPHTPYIGPEDSPWPFRAYLHNGISNYLYDVFGSIAWEQLIWWYLDQWTLFWLFTSFTQKSPQHIEMESSKDNSESSLLTKGYSMAGRQVIICHTSCLNLQGLFEGRAYPIVLPRPSDYLSHMCLITESSILASKHPP